MIENSGILLNLVDNYNSVAEQKIEYRINEPMSKHTSFRIGGSSDIYFVPHDRKSLIALCKILNETETRYYFIGNGSNLLFDDKGFEGAVVSLTGLNRTVVIGNEIVAAAGATLTSLCKTARDNSLTGLEFAYGIPGTVGGAVTMNAGAYDGEISFVLKESTYLDLSDFTLHTISVAEHDFGYRESVYKNSSYVILEAVFALEHGVEEEITFKMNDFMNRRVTKQPLEFPSAGSIFKRYPGRYTGQMIEEAGLKGYSIGGAQVSEKHAGFIINKGGATCKDVLELISYIKAVILEKYGCELECEVIHVQ